MFSKKEEPGKTDIGHTWPKDVRKKAVSTRLKFLTVFLLLVIVAVLYILLNPSSLVVGTISQENGHAAYMLLNASLEEKRYTYVDFLEAGTKDQNNKPADNSNTDGTAPLVRIMTATVAPPDNPDGSFTEAVEISYGQSAEYEITAVEGLYQFSASYFLAEKNLSPTTIAVEVNGETQYEEMGYIDVPLTWRDAAKVFPVDSYGDEIIPAQIPDEGWQTFPFYDNTYTSARPLLFRLKSGVNLVTITNTSAKTLYLAGFTATAPEEPLTYSQYLNHLGDQQPEQLSPPELINLDAVGYSSKNSSYIQLISSFDPSLTPFDPVNKKLNIIDGGSWNRSGQTVTYTFAVKTAGLYHLALHGSAAKDDFSIFRSLWIDGELPFKEAEHFAVPAYADNRWQNLVFGAPDGNPYMIFLAEGEHTLSLRAETEPVEQALRDLQLVIDHINQFKLEVVKITGKELDKNRTWKLSRYIPETADYLAAYDTLLRRIINELSTYTDKGYKSADLAPLAEAIVLLDKIREKPDELPIYLENLAGGSVSVLQLVGSAMDQLIYQGLNLDSVYIYGDAALPPANASWLSKLSSGIKQLTSSYISPKYVVRNDPDAVNIWVNSSIIQVDALQKLIDARFAASSGIKVHLSVMPDANKLVLATAAGNEPDLALGLEPYRPFELASRGATYDLSSFDDFWQVAGRFAPGTLVPFIFNEKVYALPETLDFYSLVYREDVFRNLNLTPPDTWEDVEQMMPELQRYGMNFYHPIASGDGYKWYYQTSPLIYQNGGRIYSEDGLRVEINSPESVRGITMLGELFTTYALSEQIPVFYNSFRYGTVPVGIIDLNTYLLLKNGAPELTGQWSLAPYPGTKQADGTVARWFISNGRCGIVFKNTDKPDMCWEFLKWWLSEDVQTEYAFNLQSTYGPAFLWLPSNLAALANSSLDEKDKKVILDQVKWIRDVPRTPGQYMTERSLSDIWNMIVFDGVSAQVAIDSKLINIQREMKRKMTEFGFLDKDGHVIKPYVVRDVDWVIDQIKTKGGGAQ